MERARMIGTVVTALLVATGAARTLGSRSCARPLGNRLSCGSWTYVLATRSLAATLLWLSMRTPALSSIRVRAGRPTTSHTFVLWLVVVLSLTAGGCVSTHIERGARVRFGERLLSVQDRSDAATSERPSVFIRLKSGPLRDEDGYAMLGALASQVAAESTIAASVFAPRDDGTGDLWSYDWSPTTRMLIKFEARSSDPQGEGMMTAMPTFFAEDVGAPALSAGSVVLRPWPDGPSEDEDVSP